MPGQSPETPSLHKVVVVGAGFAGLEAVRGLRKARCHITLIDQRNHHLFQPLLYQAATTILSPSEIAWPIRGLLKHRADVTTLMATVEGVRPGEVILREGEAISYDSLVIATGSRTSYFGHDDWQEVAPGLKTLEDATLIRRRLLLAFERAELTTDPDARAALLTIAIIGGGPTGVELAGIIAELSRETIRREFRRIDTRSTRILLIEAGPRLLGAFPETLSTYAARSLQRRGVEVHLGTAVSDVTETGIRLGDAFISCCTVVWAAGVTASPVGDWLGVKTGKDRRVSVTSDLAVVDHPQIFVIGDAAAVAETPGALVPQLAPAAKQQGAHVAKVIAARLANKPPPPAFRYRHAGNLATIGKRSAVVQFGRIELTGGLAWWIWGIAHIYFLIGTRNRVAVAWDWLWTYLRGLSAARLITDPLPSTGGSGPSGKVEKHKG